MNRHALSSAQQALTASCVFDLPVFGFDELIAGHARHRGELPAFIDGERVLTWREFEIRVARVAESLLRAGIDKGDRIALLATNSFWTYEVMFGIVRVGAVVTPLSPLLPPAQQATLLTDSAARLLFAGRGFERLATQAAVETGGALRVIFEAESMQSERSYQAFMADTPGTFAGGMAEPGDTFGIIYSSGTTGIPKGIMHSHAGRLAMGWQTAGAFGVTTESRCLLATPPSSNGTMLMLLPAMAVGAACIFTRSVAPDDFFALLPRQKPTHAFMVPTQLGAIFTDPRAAQADFSGFRCLLSAGAPLPAHVKQRMFEHAGHCFHELWGFTEGVATVIGPADAARRPQSVGRSLSGTDIRVIDAAGMELRAPAVGELVGRSNIMMQGYLNRPDANAQIQWHDSKGDVFLRTGDIGAIDEQGFITLRGRIKEMIISGGLNVYPSDIEAVLILHPSVHDAAVIGIADDKWGEAPVAYVITKPEASIELATLKEWTNARVAKHQRVTDVVLHVGDFPRNALGKVLKNELRSAYAKAR